MLVKMQMQLNIKSSDAPRHVNEDEHADENEHCDEHQVEDGNQNEAGTYMKTEKMQMKLGLMMKIMNTMLRYCTKRIH